MQYCLYWHVANILTAYRVYGPHVYQFELQPAPSKHVIQNHWVPVSIPAEKIMNNPNFNLKLPVVTPDPLFFTLYQNK